MDAVSNPYSPGAGLRPGLVAGRQDEIDSFDAVLQRSELGRSSRGMILTGLRGVGKTVLLNEMANLAEDRDWIVARLEVRPEGARAVLTHLTALLVAGVRSRQGSKPSETLKRALRSIKAFSLTVDPSGALGATINVEAVGSGDVEIDLTELAKDVGRAAQELGIGVAVFIDELQELDQRSLASLASAAHGAGQRNVPFIVCGAGLPNLPGKLSDAKSYSERLFDYRSLGKLDERTATDALAVPATDAGVTWEAGAISATVTAAGGYPYFLQQFGSATWEGANGPLITAADASRGIRLGQAILDGGFFRARWDRATATERMYLRAMAADDGTDSRTPDVAERLARAMRSLGPIRAALINKGLIYAPEYGLVAFTVPAMADFIQRQIEP